MHQIFYEVVGVTSPYGFVAYLTWRAKFTLYYHENDKNPIQFYCSKIDYFS